MEWVVCCRILLHAGTVQLPAIQLDSRGHAKKKHKQVAGLHPASWISFRGGGIRRKEERTLYCLLISFLKPQYKLRLHFRLAVYNVVQQSVCSLSGKMVLTPWRAFRKLKGTLCSHMSRDGFYGIDQSATSAQGLENTIRARWWVESVPGPLKRGQEPSFKRAGNASGTPFCPLFLEMAILTRPLFDPQFSDE